MSDAQVDAESEAVVPDPKTVRSRQNWLSVARKEVADAGRSWQLYVLTGAFVAVLVLGNLETAQRPAESIDQAEIPFETGMKSLAGYVDFLIPLVILIGVHMAIAGERERGSLRVTLALPVSRQDVLVGTALGRAAVVAGTLLAALAANGVAMWILYDAMDFVAYAKFAVAVVVFGIVFVGIAVGISAMARTSNRALGPSIVVFFVTVMWDDLLGVVDLITGVRPQLNPLGPNVAPGWRVLLHRIRPGEAWQLVVTDWIVPVMHESGGRDGETFYAAYTTPGPEPFYLDTWVLVIVLMLWCVVPLVVGYWRLREADLQ